MSAWRAAGPRLLALAREWREWQRVQQEPDLVRRWRALCPPRVAWYPSQFVRSPRPAVAVSQEARR